MKQENQRIVKNLPFKEYQAQYMRLARGIPDMESFLGDFKDISEKRKKALFRRLFSAINFSKTSVL